MPTDPILVELVGQTWWQSLLPVLAILISLVSLAVTLLLKFRDDARVTVTSAVGLFMGGGSRQPHVSLTATNVGRTGKTVLTSLHLRVPKGISLHTPRPLPGAATLPKTLEPGESANQFIPVSEIQAVAAEAGFDPLRLVVVAVTGHGERVYPLSEQVKRTLTTWR